MRSSGSMGAQIGTLIVATSGIQLANGFFGTFISLRVDLEDFDATMAGLVLSGYFAGFTVGALRCERIIERIGHIRAYAAFAGLVVAATAAMPLLVGSVPWLVLRAFVGFGCAGLFVTTESWLSAKAPPSERGRVFSIYMVGTFLALAVGQLLIVRADLETAAPFNTIVALFAVALVLVSTTRAEPPQGTAAPILPLGQLLRGAPVAVAGCAVNGLIAGAFYALVPAWMQDEGIERATIGLFMLVAVLGGFMSTLYPVCVADAHDRLPADRVVAVSSRLILVSGLGSVLGPLIGMSLKVLFDIDGVFYLMAAAALLLALLAAGRSLTSPSPLHLRRPFKILAPQAAPRAHDPIGSSVDPQSPAGVPPEGRRSV